MPRPVKFALGGIGIVALVAMVVRCVLQALGQ